MTRKYVPGKIRLAKLEVCIMPNDEIICAGKHIGWMNEKAKSWCGKKLLGDFIEEVDNELPSKG